MPEQRGERRQRAGDEQWEEAMWWWVAAMCVRRWGIGRGAATKGETERGEALRVWVLYVNG